MAMFVVISDFRELDSILGVRWDVIGQMTYLDVDAGATRDGVC